MGCSVSQLDDDQFWAQRQWDNSINQQLQLDQRKSNPELRVLLLGPGESGKLTVLKQMKLLHKGGFADIEREQYARVIWVDVISSMRQLIINARKLEIPLDCDQPGSRLQESKRAVLRVDPDVLLVMNEFVGVGIPQWRQQATHYEDKVTNTRRDIALAIRTLWLEDSGIKKCFDRLNEFHLLSSADYYFGTVDKYVDPDYKCNDEDILMARIKTTGITETDFDFRLFTFKVLDAGGQRLERRKWLHYFENISSVLYVMAVLEYDQMLFEDDTVNRMKELLELFEDLCNSRWFWNTPFIIFMNKVDLLKKKLPLLPMKAYYPDFQGRADNVDDALHYFELRLHKANRSKKQLYIHHTCATDTQSMAFVINAVTDLVIQDSLRALGLI